MSDTPACPHTPVGSHTPVCSHTPAVLQRSTTARRAALRSASVLAAAVIAAGSLGPAAPASAAGLTEAPADTGPKLQRPVLPEVSSLSGHVRDTNPAQPEPAAAGSGLAVGKPAYVAVTVATLWTKPSSPRAVDKPALGNPVDLAAWDRNLKKTEVRRGLTGRTQTQALYGDEVRVQKLEKDWAKVAVVSQTNPGDAHGYEAWVPRIQLIGGTDFGTQITRADTAVVTAQTAAITEAPGGRTLLEAPMNARLPVLTRDAAHVRVRLPDGATGWVAAGDVRTAAHDAKQPAPTGEELVRTAKQFEGDHYLWAGTSQYGFDCSGFTYAVYRAHGVDIPRDSGPQSKAGTRVKASQLQPGDLLFFAGKGGKGKVHHVGLYIGGGKIIHAPNASKKVEIVDWKKWDRGGQFAGAKRYL